LLGQFANYFSRLFRNKFETNLLTISRAQDREFVLEFNVKLIFKLTHFVLISVDKNDVWRLKDFYIVFCVLKICMS
jgi:hypothetical protein